MFDDIQTMRTLLSTDFPDRRIVSNGVLSEEGKMLIGGDAKAGKTHIALEITAELACGRPFLQTFEVRKACRVALFQFEIGLPMVRKWYAPFYDIWGDDRIIDNVFITCTRKFRINEEGQIEELHGLLATIEPDVVVFDPLYYMHSADENKTDEMTGVARLLDEVIETHHCCVILIHHKKKPTMDSRGTRIRGGAADFRGSSVLWGWPDTLLDVTKRGQYQGVDIDFERRDFDEPLSTLKMDWAIDGLPLRVIDGSQPTVTTGVVIKVAKALAEQLGGEFPQGALEDALAGRSSESTAKRTITRLVAEGVLEAGADPNDKRRKMLRLVGGKV